MSKEQTKFISKKLILLFNAAKAAIIAAVLYRRDTLVIIKIIISHRDAILLILFV